MVAVWAGKVTDIPEVVQVHRTLCLLGALSWHVAQGSYARPATTLAVETDSKV